MKPKLVNFLFWSIFLICASVVLVAWVMRLIVLRTYCGADIICYLFLGGG